MTINDLEKQIIEILEINSKIDWDMNPTSPDKEFEDLINIIKQKFKDYKKHNKQ